MQTLLKAFLSLIVILAATGIARRFPSLAGLVAVMPLTGALVLTWVYIENKGNSEVMEYFTKGAFLGMAPTILFFLVAFLCSRRQLSLPITLLASFATWFAAAIVHQILIK